MKPSPLNPKSKIARLSDHAKSRIVEGKNPKLAMASFSHLSLSGEVRMVPVGQKPETDRVATARAVVLMAPTTLKMIRNDKMAKGNVLTTAQIAGMNAAKHTGTLIPMCHPIALTHVEIVFEFSHKPSSVIITATAAAHAKTGVEMEAMTAASVAALTIYDMCKSVERGMKISEVELIHKSGGKSGVWDRYSGQDRKGSQ